MIAFETYLTYLRRSKKLDQIALGNLIGVSMDAVSSWETGKRHPSESSRRKLSTVYGFDIDERYHNLKIIARISNEEALATMPQADFDLRVDEIVRIVSANRERK